MPITVWHSVDKRVRKEIITPGLPSKTPTEGSTVHITIESCAINGTNNIDAKQQWNSEILDGVSKKSFVIGESTCVFDQQIERAIQMMMLHERSLVTVLHGSDPIDFLIGAPAEIKILITLDKMDLNRQIWEWRPEEKYQVALKYKEMGVCLYKAKRVQDAFHKFSRACKILITMEPMADLEVEKSLHDKISNLRLILYNNMASCQLNRGNHEHVITLCSKVIVKDQNNVKALYRRGVAYGSLQDVERATDDLKQVLALEPENTAAREQYMKYKALLVDANLKSVAMTRRMFKV